MKLVTTVMMRMMRKQQLSRSASLRPSAGRKTRKTPRRATDQRRRRCPCVRERELQLGGTSSE